MTRTAAVEPVASNQATPVKSSSLLLQRKCACGGSAGLSGKCEDCTKGKAGVQRSAAGPATGVAPPIVNEVLRSPGQPLDAATRAYMEPRFGHDFSRVKVHADATAARSADAVDALAYTVGRDVVFAAGRYSPHHGEGRKLLAHELTHVVQQHGGGSADGPVEMSSPADAAEREASRTADTLSAGRPDSRAVRTESPLLVARQAVPQAPQKGGVPCAPKAYRAQTRKVDLQPVFFKDSATDKSPTGASWSRRLTSANTIWGKLGVTFNALSATVLKDAKNKTAAIPSSADFATLGKLVNSAGVTVFMLDNPLAARGGGSTLGGGAGSAKVALSDGGASDTLMAHELSHVLGLHHSNADPNTIAVPSGSRDKANSTRNTIANYNHITWPAPGNPTCILPDA